MYNYPEHYSKSAYSAIKLAEKLKDKGEYDYFRGQPHTFDIQPTILRKGVNKEESLDRLNEFANWVHNTPELKSLHNNTEAILAVAQHYGLKTNLLDFTTSPTIAGFFATHNSKKGNIGTIICLNKKRFQESWKDLNEGFFAKNHYYLTELIEIDVKNLWRLQAQQGLFLKCQVNASLLEMHSCFLHIYFPQDGKTEILESELVYPPRKSHLEVLLDQYFLIDSYPERRKNLEAIFGTVINVTKEDDILKEIKTYFKDDDLPKRDESWNEEKTNDWLTEPDERYSDMQPDINVIITMPETNSISEFEINILKQIEKQFALEVFHRQNITWQINSINGATLYIESDGSIADKITEFKDYKVSEMIDSIYLGMRNLPYSINHILKAISRYLVFIRFGIYEVMKDPYGIELSGGQVRGRGFCESSKIKDALRDDFFSLIKPEKLNSKNELNIRDIVFTASQIRHSYSFEKFINLFVEDIIPTQAAVAVEGLIIVVNPMRIDILGES